MYLQHLMFHSVPLLWRLHMVHHADLDIDVTTGLRFHPIEILISMGIKVAAVAVMGPPVTAVLIFEVILNGTAMLNMEMCICRTPSIEYCGSWWDRIFGTYRAQPVAGHQGMTIGLAQFRDPKKLTLLHLLVLPFTGYPGSYAINKSGMEPVKKKKKKKE